ncbi:MAG: hypothetical protein M5U09_27530 [Gammaproteobacteria bacterium]|nr:hypothetical protein [Gammaproteobacteria bacterium]
MRALIDTGVPVSWHPLIQAPGGYRQTCSSEALRAALATSRDVEPLLNALHAPVDHDTVVVHLTPEHWPGFIEPGKRMVGYTTGRRTGCPLIGRDFSPATT